MANYLLLNQPQVFNGLGTLTFTVPSTGQYNASLSITVPEAVAQGSVAGSGLGLGSGTGGGGEGFTKGDQGLGEGGVGQGFGAGNNYQQPSSQASNQVAGESVSSGVSIVVKNGVTTIFTAPALAFEQSALQFKYGFSAEEDDVITVVIASSEASDNGLNGVKSIVAINEGLI